MIDTIQEQYMQRGRHLDLANLIKELVTNPMDEVVEGHEYLSAEAAIHEQFQQFVIGRPVAARRNYTAHFGTKLWETITYEPVRLLSDPNKGNLNVIPFAEYDEFGYYEAFRDPESAHPNKWRDTSPREAYLLSKAIGFYLTPYSPRKVLNHVTMTHPWFRNYSTHIGVVRRFTIHPTTDCHEEMRFQKGNQQKFGKFLREIVQFESGSNS